MGWKFDVVEVAHESGERCGRCGEPVAPGAAICPACGALLDAYRMPSESPHSTINNRPEASRDDRPEQTGDRPIALTGEGDLSTIEAIEPELVEEAPDASDEVAAETHFVSVEPENFETNVIVPPPSERVVQAPTTSPRRAPHNVQRVPRPVARAMPELREAAPSRPRKPGFLTRGTVEPVILLGVVLLVLAICLVTLASLVSVRGFAVAGFILGALGILGIALAVLAALVRRERGAG
jgi:uncharacterized Zn finger protein (UPF0148 family)